MSILGYSASYFLPQYWVNTPLYGEKIIPLLDYVLSTDFDKTEQLASAFYNISSKYKNTQDLPTEQIEAIIDECGYGYAKDLLSQDDDSLRVLVYLLVMIHQLKGSKRGVKAVMELLRSPEDAMVLSYIGSPLVSGDSEVSGFTTSDYVVYTNFSAYGNFDINFQIRTGSNFVQEQCIASSPNYGFYLGIDVGGRIVLKLGQQYSGQRAWQEINGQTLFTSTRTLRTNTNYTVNFSYNGTEYMIKVTVDGTTYYYLSVLSTESLEINGGYVYLGIDKSTNTTRFPFGGYISLAPFTVASDNVILTQWYEAFPVEKEDTFKIESELDVGVISADFFVNFANFVEKYVYPTLTVFLATLAAKNKITFLPYTRQRITYVSSNIREGSEPYKVKERYVPEHVPYKVEGEADDAEDFLVKEKPESN